MNKLIKKNLCKWLEGIVLWGFAIYLIASASKQQEVAYPPAWSLTTLWLYCLSLKYIYKWTQSRNIQIANRSILRLELEVKTLSMPQPLIDCHIWQYCAVLCSAVKCSTVQCSVVQCRTIQWPPHEYSWVHVQCTPSKFLNYHNQRLCKIFLAGVNLLR